MLGAILRILPFSGSPGFVVGQIALTRSARSDWFDRRIQTRPHWRIVERQYGLTAALRSSSMEASGQYGTDLKAHAAATRERAWSAADRAAAPSLSRRFLARLGDPGNRAYMTPVDL